MTEILGRNCVVETSTDDSTYYPIQKVISAAWSHAIGKADKTTCDSGGYINEGYNDAQLTITITCKYDGPPGATTGQGQLLAEAFTNKTGIYVRFFPLENTGTNKAWKALFLAPDEGMDVNPKEYEEFSVTLTSTGTITYKTQDH